MLSSTTPAFRRLERSPEHGALRLSGLTRHPSSSKCPSAALRGRSAASFPARPRRLGALGFARPADWYRTGSREPPPTPAGCRKAAELPPKAAKADSQFPPTQSHFPVTGVFPMLCIGQMERFQPPASCWQAASDGRLTGCPLPWATVRPSRLPTQALRPSQHHAPVPGCRQSALRRSRFSGLSHHRPPCQSPDNAVPMVCYASCGVSRVDHQLRLSDDPVPVVAGVIRHDHDAVLRRQ